MATYKDDLDIIKAAEKDSSKLSLNAITELDNKGMLGMYGGGGGLPTCVMVITESVKANSVFLGGPMVPVLKDGGEVVMTRLTDLPVGGTPLVTGKTTTVVGAINVSKVSNVKITGDAEIPVIHASNLAANLVYWGDFTIDYVVEPVTTL